ncbi:hypothetical protein GR157_03590 [Burkholderia sp. 4701]|nr:hypothetical protein [Burkholderia sp. 4701]MXN80932.1 hypothetical protein [Burkholderia sp. 4812]
MNIHPSCGCGFEAIPQQRNSSSRINACRTRLLTIDAALRSRIYSIYMLVYYAAGALDSIIGPVILARYGWSAVCKLAVGG